MCDNLSVCFGMSLSALRYALETHLVMADRCMIDLHPNDIGSI